jgi:hypothetical protein
MATKPSYTTRGDTIPPDRWMLWDQNERPRLVPIEIETRRPTFTLSLDGSHVLIMGNLSLVANGPSRPPP